MGPVHPMSLQRLRRSATFNIADQVLSGASNAANIALAAVLLESQAEAGSMMLALTAGYVAVNVNRALVGDVLLVKISASNGTNAAHAMKDAISFTAALASAAALVLVWAGLILPNWGLEGTGPVVAVGAVLPFVLLQDAGRYSSFAVGMPRLALFSDLAWIGVQAVITVGLVILGQVSATLLVVAWGSGAAVGAAFLWHARLIRFHRQGIGRWVKSNHRISGWFTLASVVSQLQVQVVAIAVTSILGSAAYAALRLLQTIILSPAQNLMMAMMGVLVPRMSLRFVETGTTAGPTGFRRLVVMFAAGAGTMLIVLNVAAPWAITRFLPAYAEATPLIFPISLQMVLYLIQIPFAASMRAARMGWSLALSSIIFTGVTCVSVLVGSHIGGLLGAAWGIFIGCLVNLGLHVYIGSKPLAVEKALEVR